MKNSRVRRASSRRSRKNRRLLMMRRMPLIGAGLAAVVVAAVAGGLLLHKNNHASALTDLPDFRLECGVDHYAPDDPIVFPGQPGKSHMHSFYSNESTNAFSTTDSLAASPGSCAYMGAFDHSAYWIPSVYFNNADGTSTQYTSNSQNLIVYYRRVGGVNGPLVHPFPVGLRMIAGDSHASAPQPSSITSWDCSDGGPSYSYIPDCTSVNGTPVGFVSFPNCWDGVHLDSADHKSHMAYANQTTGACPADHPVSLPRIDFEDWLRGTTGSPNAVLSSGGVYSMHGDVYAAWDMRLQQGLIDTCMNTTPDNCSTVQVWNGCCGTTNGDVTVNNGVFKFNLNNPKYASPTPFPSASPTPTLSVAPAPGDINGDGKVNVLDLSTLLSNWGKNTASVDLNHDGTVNVLDLSVMLSHWTG